MPKSLKNKTLVIFKEIRLWLPPWLDGQDGDSVCSRKGVM